MEIILDRDKYNNIWDKIFNDFHFCPSCKTHPQPWLLLPMNHKKYHLNSVFTFTEEQEKIINSIFCRVHANDMYALDWHHDCFIYNPCEEIPLDYWFYDTERKCNVYFPSYYPDGDYHFFTSFDWSIGLYGHPWDKELIVVGERLIEEFDKVQDILNITEV
ncbi:DUF2716 domain-containing protein [Butyricicoccus sp. 1XD8-22]|nr:DUF2716 domain-containing protein [Butyricicoccus sp. 1XD8-22]